MKSVHLFAGAGGGVLADVSLGHEPVCLVEWDAAAQAVLRKRFPQAAVHGDVCAFDGKPWRGVADIVCGGWPCQDVSSAGSQKGMAKGAGTRSALAFEFVRVVSEVRPRYVFAENVANVVSARHKPDLDAMLADLAALGYGGAWCILSAAQVGAPHLRKRFWLLAERGRSGWSEVRGPERYVGDTWPTPTLNGNNNRPYPGKKSADGLETAVNAAWPTPRVGGRGTVEFVRDDGKVRDDLETTTFMDASAWPTPTCEAAKNTASASRFTRNTVPLHAEVFPEQIRAAIGDRRINPDWVENLMGWPIGWTDLTCDHPVPHGDEFAGTTWPAGRGAPQLPHEPPRITSVKPRSPDAKARNARLKQLGNGQVPQCAAAAFTLLRNALGENPTDF